MLFDKDTADKQVEITHACAGGGAVSGGGAVPAPAPGTDLPQTGDSTNLALWLLLTAAGACGLAGLEVYKYVQRKREG